MENTSAKSVFTYQESRVLLLDTAEKVHQLYQDVNGVWRMKHIEELGEGVEQMAVSPDGRRIAVLRDNLAVEILER